MMTILLYGRLGKKFGKVHKYLVNSPAEAVRALCATIKGFKEELAIGSYRLLDGRLDSYGEKDINNPLSLKSTFRLIPVVEGSGGDGIFNVVLGVFLIWASGGLASMGLTGLMSAGTAATAVMSFGISMLVGGISSMLFSPETPQQSNREEVTNAPSFAFNGAVNTVAQGNAVPVCYGRLIVGSQVISAGLSVEQTT